MYSHVIVILFVVVQIILSKCTKLPPQNRISTTRIVGGTRAQPNQFPWQALITLRDSKAFCGGSVISTKHVLTAAHCNEKRQKV